MRDSGRERRFQAKPCGCRDFQGRRPVLRVQGTDPGGGHIGRTRKQKGGAQPMQVRGRGRDAAPASRCCSPVPCLSLMILLALNRRSPLFGSLSFATGRYSHAQRPLG